jgi:hypothetical protein
MAEMRERPYAGANFLVDFGAGDGRAASAGFCEVIFPVFRAAPDAWPAPTAPPAQGGGATGAAPSQHLVLRRGVTGSLDLYAWWNKARRGKAPQRRTLKIQLLGEDHATVVLTWRLRNVRPVSLGYSPLRALDGGVLIETLELAFDGMEMC